MVLALVKKDLRETRLFAVLSLGLYLVHLSQLTGKGSNVLAWLFELLPFGMDTEAAFVPFVQGDFFTMYFFISVILAIALGFRQSAWEPSQGTTLYLLHLPLARRTIFLTKLLTGVGLLLACTIMPIVVYAVWASLPRTHPGPFEWSMTRPAFQIWLLMPLAYLGAFASGLRPARWFGSKLLPLLAVAVPALFLYLLPQWWLIALPLLVVFTAVLVSDILWEAETRDF